MKLPHLPRSISTALGDVAVRALPKVRRKKGSILGLARFHKRTIEINHSASHTTQWQALWHEMTHFALFDGGANNALTETQVEHVCDAIGTFLTQMMLAGRLTLHDKK